MNYYGQLDMTRLQDIITKHPEAFKRVIFKSDGREHILLPIDVKERQQASENGSVAYIRANVKEPKEGVNIYISDLRVSQFQNDGNAPQQPQVKETHIDSLEELLGLKGK